MFRSADRVASALDPLDSAPLNGAGIAAIGRALPESVVPTDAIASRLGVAPGWIVTRTGVHERRHAGASETLAELAAAAGGAALAQGGMNAGEVDVVLVATFTQDELLPNAAPVVADLLGAAGAGAIDVGSACSGFLSGLALGAALIESGRAGTVLLIGADLMSRVIDHQDRRTAGLFGDGAGAAVLTGGGAGRIGPIVMRSDGAGANLVTATHTERVLRMRGQDTFRTAIDRIALSTMEALDAAALTLADIDLFVYHQANARILAAVGDRLGLPSGRVVDCIGRYGNTSAASIPIALCEAEQEGRLLAGHRVLVGAFAAGLTWGAGVLEWGAEA
jgi:3-oxoacyl-[acyl-carrier-protein] synthase III